MQDKTGDLTITQLAFLKTLSDQRVADLTSASDLVGDMDAETIFLLRLLSHQDGRILRKFLLEVRPETLQFLTDLRKKEIEDIGAAIETAIALRRTFKFMRWGITAFMGAMLTMAIAWEKIASLLSTIFKSGASK
jgi:hypothetical protein